MNLGSKIYHLHNDIKVSIRKLEKVSLKLIKSRTNKEFNTLCIQNGLFPKYTNHKLHDPRAKYDEFVKEFKINLLKRELESRKKKFRIAKLKNLN